MMADELIVSKRSSDVLEVLAEEILQEEFAGAFNEDDYKDAPPDGGYGWFCCAYIMAMNFSTWGVNCSFGIFLSFYLNNNVFPGATPTDYALVGGIVVCLTLLLIPYSAIMLLKFGYRVTVSIAIIVQLSAFIGASFVKTIAGLYITQGVLTGISYGLMFGANSMVLPSWFLKKRALANGISHIGVGLGGVVFTPVVNKLINSTGDQKWALRTLGIISFVICTTCMFLVKIRVQKNIDSSDKENTKLKSIFKKTFDYKIWTMYPLILATLWACITSMGYVICLYSLSNFATSVGYTSHQAMIITVVLNIGQTFGRPLMGYLSEVIGRVNLTILASLYTCIMVFVFWINLQNYASLIIFGLMLGLFVGIGSVNVVPLVVDVVGLNSFASGLGLANSCCGIMSLIGEVIALRLRDYSLVKKNPYFHCQIFVGCLYITSTLVLIPYRHWKITRIITQLKSAKGLDETERLKFERLSQDKSIRGYFERAFLWKKV